MSINRSRNVIERWTSAHHRWLELMSLPDVEDLHIEDKAQEWHLGIYTLVALEDTEIAGVLRFWTRVIGVDEDKPAFMVEGEPAVEGKVVTFHVLERFRNRGIGRGMQLARAMGTRAWLQPNPNPKRVQQNGQPPTQGFLRIRDKPRSESSRWTRGHSVLRASSTTGTRIHDGGAVTHSMSALSMLAEHNEWANRLIFAACSKVDAAGLSEGTDGYDSVIGILKHLVQVEHSFFELAHGRAPQRIVDEELSALSKECARIDRAYVDYAGSLDPAEAEAKRFLVPWFGFEITLTEGVLQPLTHSHKHRADVSMLLPRLGGAGIEMDLIQWLDEERGSR